VVRDPPDNCILECAQAVGSEFIITGDQDLLRLGKFGVLCFWRNVPSPKLPVFVPNFEFGPRFPQPILVNTSHCGTHLVQVGSDVGAVGNRLPLCKQQQVVGFGSQLVSHLNSLSGSRRRVLFSRPRLGRAPRGKTAR
jgi:hypothetical protein